MSHLSYATPSGITVTRKSSRVPYGKGLERLLTQLDRKRGAYFSSGYEYPERYSRWDVATLAPPIEIVGRERSLAINALNERGKMFLRILDPLLAGHPHWDYDRPQADSLHMRLRPLAERFSE